MSFEELLTKLGEHNVKELVQYFVDTYGADWLTYILEPAYRGTKIEITDVDAFVESIFGKCLILGQ